jgi:hypothetical protein
VSIGEQVEPSLLVGNVHLSERFYGFSYVPQSYLPKARFENLELFANGDSIECKYRKAVRATTRLGIPRPDFTCNFFASPENRIFLFDEADFESICFFIGIVLMRSSLRNKIVGNDLRELFKAYETQDWSLMLWPAGDEDLASAKIKADESLLCKVSNKDLLCGAGFQLIISQRMPLAMKKRLLLRADDRWVGKGYLIEGGLQPLVGRILNSIFNVWRPLCAESLFA